MQAPGRFRRAEPLWGKAFHLVDPRVPAAALGLLLFTSALLFVMWPMFGAEFGPIDDHEIAIMLGPDGHVAPGELPGLLADWTVETNGRFRPGYYALRVLEAFIAGPNATQWYIHRAVLAIIAAGSLVFLLRKRVPWPALLVIALPLVAGIQAEVWFRLGPQEAYGLPLLLGGLALVRLRRVWLGLALVLIAGLTKESFTAVLPAVGLWLFVREGPSVRFAVFVAGAVVEGVAMAYMSMRFGGFYAQVRTLDSVGTAASGMLRRLWVQSLWLAPLAVSVAADLRGVRQRIVAIGLTSGLVLIVLPQAVIYGGYPPSSEGRYLVPAVLFAVGAAALGYWVLGTRREPGWRAVTWILVAAMATTMAIQLPPQRALAARRAQASHDFQRSLGELVTARAASPPRLTILRPVDVLRDYEPMVSVVRYLASRGDADALAVEPPVLRSGALGNERRIYEAIVGDSQGADPFVPLSPDTPRDACIEVAFGEPHPAPRCGTVVVIRGV